MGFGKRQQQTEKPRRTRRRPALSCIECRRRKVKCDRRDPCCHCVLWKTTCRYSPRAADEARVNVKCPLEAAAKDSEKEFAPGSKAMEQQRPLVLPAWAPKGITLASVGDETLQIGSETRLCLRKACLHGRTHWSEGGHNFRAVSAFINHEKDPDRHVENETTRRIMLDMRAIALKYKTLASSIKSSRPSIVLSTSNGCLLGGRDVADEMVRLYVSRFESAFRILHIPSLWAEYEQYWNSHTDAPESLRLRIRLVMAIGSSLRPEVHVTHSLRSDAVQVVHDAQAWVSGPFEKNRISIGGLQIQCLLLLARQVLNIGGDLVWVTMGTVLRTAMRLGLHRDPRHFDNMTLLHSEMRRRLWATIMEMNIQAAFDAGAPPGISLDDYDTQPPLSCNDDDLRDAVYNLEPGDGNVASDTSLQRHLASLLKPRLEMVQKMNRHGSSIDYETVSTLTSTITKGCRECIKHAKTSVLDGGAIFRRNLADLLLRRFILPLHRPWVDRSRSDTLSYASRKQSVDIAMALLSPPPDQGFSQLCSMSGGLFRHRLIHVTLGLLSELLMEMDEHGVGSSLEEPCGYRKMLVAGAEEARRQWEQRVPVDGASVKMHLKTCIILCQARTARTGAALQHEMAQSGRASLELCYSLLETSSWPLEPAGVDVLGDVLGDGVQIDFVDFDDIWLSNDGMAQGMEQSFW